jgi:RimJ/RimL family protein N-acetyltransferase
MSESGEPLGFVQLTYIDHDARSAEVGIAIAPEHRGKNIGRQALATLHQYAASLGLRRLWLRVKPENKPAVALYTRAGYVPFDTVQGQVLMTTGISWKGN